MRALLFGGVRRRGLIWLLLIAGFAAVFASALRAGQSKSCTDVVNTTPDGTYTRYCGPARAHLLLDGKAYDLRGGTCEVTRSRKTREFGVDIGWRTAPWPGKIWKGSYLGIGLSPYAGSGKYSVANRAFVMIVVTPRSWQTLGDKTSREEGAPKAWSMGTVSISGNGTRGTFTLPVEDAPGRPNDPVPPLDQWLSVRAAGSFTCR